MDLGFEFFWGHLDYKILEVNKKKEKKRKKEKKKKKKRKKKRKKEKRKIEKKKKRKKEKKLPGLWIATEDPGGILWRESKNGW